MKLSVKEIVYLGISSIIFLFIIGAVFYMNFSGKEGMLKAAGEVYEANKEEQIICSKHYNKPEFLRNKLVNNHYKWQKHRKIFYQMI